MVCRANHPITPNQYVNSNHHHSLSGLSFASIYSHYDFAAKSAIS
jgi:hypothetical protein